MKDIIVPLRRHPPDLLHGAPRQCRPLEAGGAVVLEEELRGGDEQVEAESVEDDQLELLHLVPVVGVAAESDQVRDLRRVHLLL